MGVYCNFCDITFPDGGTYEKMCPHRVTHQIIAGATSAKRDKPIAQAEIREKSKDDLTCPHCEQKFTNAHGYIQHLTWHATNDIEKEQVAWLKYKASRPAPPEFVGVKHDTTKPRWSLLPAGTISQVIAVLEYGARKYQVDNWQHVTDHKRRYYDAAMRHINAWFDEKNDPESGLPHLAHAACCILFLMWFDNEEAK